MVTMVVMLGTMLILLARNGINIPALMLTVMVALEVVMAALAERISAEEEEEEEV